MSQVRRFPFRHDIDGMHELMYDWRWQVMKQQARLCSTNKKETYGTDHKK